MALTTMIPVKCLDEPERVYWYTAKTPYEALVKHCYTLNLSRLDRAAIINKTESGQHLYLVHSGKTYAVQNA